MSTLSLQQVLADALLQHFPTAEVKKINKDNYVDIHLPWVHSKRGTHLGFNTAGGTIKVVFYCREEEFVQQALINGGGRIEKYSQGIRIKGNPEFLDVESAIAAALKFIEVLEQKSGPSAGVAKPKSGTYTFDQAVNAYIQGNMDYVVAYVQAGNPVLQFNGGTLITNELISYVSAFTGVDRRIVNLVQAGVDLDASFDNGEGYTAAHFAAWDGKDEILYYLLDAGAKADVVGEDGYTPLFLAAVGGHLACIKILVEKGADVNRRLTDDNIYFSKQGGTPLTMAFINGFLETALFLIDNGADPFVLKEPCKNAPSPNLVVNFLSLVKQGAIPSPGEGQLSKILNLIGLEDEESLNGEASVEKATESKGQLDLNEFLKEMGLDDTQGDSSEGLAEEKEEINLDEVIKKFVEKQGTDDIMDLLDSYLQKGHIVVVEISVNDIIKTLTTTEYFGKFVSIAGTVEKGDSLWADLSELIGESEAEWVKEEFKEENPDSIVLLYCEGKYVYAFSNPISHNEPVNAEEAEENKGLFDLNEFLKEMGAGDDERSSEDMEEEEVNLDELIKKFIEKQGSDNILDLLDQDYSQKGDIVVVKINADDLINTLSSTDHFGDFVYIEGIINLNSDTVWAELSELIGESEVDWVKTLVQTENPDTIVLFYCGEHYVYAFSNMNVNVSGEAPSKVKTKESKDGLDLASFLESMELEEDEDESEEEEEEDPEEVMRESAEYLGSDEDDEEEEDDEGGFPMISYRKPADEKVAVVQQYLRRWQKSSQVYAWRMGIKAFVPEFVEALASDEVCPIFTTGEIDAICTRIKSEKIIPILDYVPEEFYNYTKRVWWLVPFCIWKEDVASLVFVDKNGFYGMYSQDGEEEIDTIFNWDSVYELDFEYAFDGDPNINRLTLTQEDGNFLTFDEFVSTSKEDDHGSYLAVIEAIWEARRETIEASKGEPFWAEGAGGEGFIEFEKPQDLLKAANWDNPSRPDPSMYGG